MRHILVRLLKCSNFLTDKDATYVYLLDKINLQNARALNIYQNGLGRTRKIYISTRALHLYRALGLQTIYLT